MPRRKRDGSWKPKLRELPGGNSRVRIDGVDHYCGPYGSPGAEAKYQRLVSAWLAGEPLAPPPRAADGPSVSELLDAFLDHAGRHYRKGGRPTAEWFCFRKALKPVLDLYGPTPAAGFAPPDLLAVRDEFLRVRDRHGKPWSRGYVNEQVNRVRRAWSWGVEQGIVLAPVADALRHVKGLKRTRTTAPEGRKVRPVAWRDVERTLPLLRPALAALVQFHRLTGCRAAEACVVRPCDVDQHADSVDGLWLYRPSTWKTEHHDQTPDAAYWLNADAQAVLGPWLEKCPTPESWAFPTGVKRTNRAGCGRYTKDSYNLAVRRAIKRHNAGISKKNTQEYTHEPIAPWSAGQIRHLRLTEVREAAHAAGRHGGEAAQAVAGHAEMGTSEIYAEKSELARAVMRDMAGG
jgi:integrase